MHPVCDTSAMKTDEIVATLHQMAVLLRAGYSASWADAYERLASEISSAPHETSRRILASYGGMGSINDLVLVFNGEMAKTENDQFATLRSRLHALCLDMISIG
jgi:hypothetical protein